MLFRRKNRAKASAAEAAQNNLEGCRVDDQWVEYFGVAEDHIDEQWERLIWPIIEGFDFTSTLELAPGAGRNSAKLLPLAGRLDVVDLNQYAIDRCRERFAEHPLRDRVHYHVNDGRSLAMLEDASVTAVYSWDSMVHMDQRVVHDYLHEFARVMRPGTRAFLHHSNYGARGDHTDFKQNPHWRSNGSADRVRRDAKAAGLETVRQQLLNWGEPELDCISVLGKP